MGKEYIIIYIKGKGALHRVTQLVNSRARSLKQHPFYLSGCLII